MTKLERAEAGEGGAVSSWTCSRCEVTVTFTSKVADPELPSTWISDGNELYCLGCRRDLAGDAGVEGLGEDAPNATRLQRRSQARIEFEIGRDPDRADNRIAKACGTSTVAVRKARDRLGLPARGAVPGGTG